MATRNLFGDLALDSTLERVGDAMESVALAIMSIKDQLPRVSSSRVASVAFDAAQPVTISSGTVTTVTTCGTVTTCATLTTARNLGELARPADALPVQTSHMGCAHIYNGIVVS
jgi:hypothetical protein